MANEEKIRIVKAIKEKHPRLSLSFIRELLDDGEVKLNGRIAKPKAWIFPNDKIEVPEKFLQTQIKPNPSLDCKVLHEDEDYLFLEKPSGIHSVCTNFLQENTVANWLLSIHPALNEVSSPLESGLCHRLDRETTGIMVAAKNRVAFDHIKLLFEKHEITKEYLCLVDQSAQIGRYTAYASNHPKSDKRVLIHDEPSQNLKCKKIITEILERNPKDRFLELKIKLITGYRHQIRAHLAHLGCPIVGDTVYNGAESSKLKLHASRIHFMGPNGKEYDVITKAEY